MKFFFAAFVLLCAQVAFGQSAKNSQLERGRNVRRLPYATK